MTIHQSRLGKVLIGSALLSLLSAVLVVLWLSRGAGPQALQAATFQDRPEKAEPITVQVALPQQGGLERVTNQPGTVRAFEYEDLFAKVNGYLIHQKVDIGTEVKKGEVLAEIEAPELVKEELHAAAVVKQAKAQIDQMKAHVEAARAEMEAAKTLIELKQAEVKRASANLDYRMKRYDRILKLANQGGIADQLVDEQFDQREAAQAWKDAAYVGVKTAEADVVAKKAKVVQAEADLIAAEANVEVAEAALQKAHEFVEFTRIRSHYNGMVTARNYHDGAYIRPPDKGQGLPLFVVQRTDLMRVIIQVPDLDAPFCDVGDPVDLSLNSLPSTRFPPFKISRIASSQDQSSRTMRVEVDVPNVTKILRDGMYGQVVIHLQAGEKDALRVPSSALDRHDGKLRVFVVREGVIHQVPVRVGLDNGTEAEILSGLKRDDLVVLHPNQQLHEGLEVKTAEELGREPADSLD